MVLENFKIIGNPCKKQIAVVHFSVEGEFRVHWGHRGARDTRPLSLSPLYLVRGTSRQHLLGAYQKTGAVPSPKLFTG